MTICEHAYQCKIKLTPYAKIFYVEWLLDPESVRNNLIIMDELHGDIDINRLRHAVKRYIEECLLLHSHLEICDAEPYWVQNAEIVGLDYSDFAASNEELLTYINRPFNLYKDQLCRFKLFRKALGEYQFVIVLQHLVIDGISMKEGLFEGLTRYYNDQNYSAICTLEQQKEKLIGLADFFDQKLSSDRNTQQEFWKKQLNEIETIDFRFLRSEKKLHTRPQLDQYNLTKKIQFEFDRSVINRLNQLKRQYRITPFYFGLCVFAILIHRYSGQKKFIIPFPIAIKQGASHIYGAQVNTILMPFQFDSDINFLELFEKIRLFLQSLKSESINYTEFPAIELFSGNNRPLLNVVFNQANFRLDSFKFDGVSQKSILENFNMYLKDVLFFEQEQKENALQYQIRFDITKMDAALVQNFTDDFKRKFIEILDDLEIGATSKSIYASSLLTQETYRRIVEDLNQTWKNFPDQRTIHALFEEQVKKTPNRIALVFDGAELSYSQLNQRANQLAAYIQKNYRPKIEELLVMYMDRSHQIVISILAVLKIGCAYVPAATDIPDRTLFHILKDTKAKIVLTNQAYQLNFIKFLERCSASALQVPAYLNVDNLNLGDGSEFSPVNVASSNLAYVLYTSGSTGVPKGVMMEHQACVNKILGMMEVSQMNQQDTVLFKTNYIFDVSFTDIFCALLAGSRIVVTKNTFDVEEISSRLSSNTITVCHFTPSQFDVIKNIKGSQIFKNLRIIHFSGEALNPQLLNDIDEKICAVNYYGPTETGEVSADVRDNFLYDRPSIGYPLPNIQLYILDEFLNPVPYGVIGELYIGGNSLARGYLNQPVLTRERFIRNPFTNQGEENKNSYIYKTGDLVRRLINGNIEFVGRNDSQIKIRGYRIELGEIENQIQTFPNIKQAVVIAQNKSHLKASNSMQEKYLIAYYVSSCKVDISGLRDYLIKRLPEYVVPEVYYQLCEFPLTQNGKLDIKLLPQIEPSKNRTYFPPKNALEEKLCASYAEVLNIPFNKVSIHDDFFQLGGDSISGIRLLFKLEQNLDIKIADVFKLRTPAKIAEFVPQAKSTLKQKIENIVQLYLKYQYASRDDQIEKTDKKIAEKHARYLDGIKNLKIYEDLKDIENVLLTGSTGHLGCNVLQKLLGQTTYKIYLFVRANSLQSAIERVAKKFKFYFDADLSGYENRLFIINADIRQANFGLNLAQYRSLAEKIDSVIHCAALVKHYGEYDEFYQSNVLPTINLLEFTKKTRGNEFNYISTVGVLADGYVPEKIYHLSNEDDPANDFIHGKNFYVQTKYKSELQVLKYRAAGVNGNIFRVGNLGMHSINYKVQENIDENLYFSHIKTMLRFGLIPDEISHMEISPVDCTAAAIVKLFDKSSLSNQTFHLFNPKTCDLMKSFNDYSFLKLKRCDLIEFIDSVLEELSTDKLNEEFHLQEIYQLWLQEKDEIHTTKMRLAQEKTEIILKKLGFSWPEITAPMLINFVKHAFPPSIDFIKELR